MKKIILALCLVSALAGCGGESNIDELISAQELPEYSETVDIQVSESEAQAAGDAIVIE